jgi:hypothetical protein
MKRIEKENMELKFINDFKSQYSKTNMFEDYKGKKEWRFEDKKGFLELEEKLNNTRFDNKNLNIKLNSYEIENSNLKKEIEKINKLNEQLNFETSRLKKELNSTKVDLENKMSLLTKEKNELNRLFFDEINKCKIQEDEIMKLNFEKLLTKKRLELLRNNQNSLKNEINDMTNEKGNKQIGEKFSYSFSFPLQNPSFDKKLNSIQSTTSYPSSATTLPPIISPAQSLNQNSSVFIYPSTSSVGFN